MGKLPSFDQDWAETQFIWGLHMRVAELVTILGPTDLVRAIHKAEEVAMGRSRGKSVPGAQEEFNYCTCVAHAGLQSSICGNH